MSMQPRFGPISGDGRWVAIVVEAAIVGFAGGALVALAAIWLGQDAGWDTLNYHVYNAYALLNGRMGWDLQPAMRQTYFNPLMDVPFYLLHTSTHTRIAALVWGGLQGIGVAAVYGIARLLMPPLRPALSIAASGAVALVAFLAPWHVAEIGRATGDSTTGVLVLLGLLLVTAAARTRGPTSDASVGEGWRLMGLMAGAGLLTGLAFGLKPTNGPYALAMAVSVQFLPLGFRSRTRATLWLLAGGLAGALATGGWWWLTMWSEFGNPLFPQLNNLFESPWIDPLSFSDLTYRGTGWLETMFYPVAYNEALTGKSIGGQTFGDIRIPLVLVLGLIAGGLALVRATGRKTGHVMRSRSGDEGAGPLRVVPLRVVVAFWAAAYVLWQVTFSIPRYLLVLEMLAPVAAVALIRLMPGTRAIRTWVAAIALLSMAATYHSVDGGRTSFGSTLFSVEPPESVRLDSALVVMASHKPLAFVIPELPPTARFVRISGNMFYPAGHERPDDRFDNRLGDALKHAIEQHGGERRYAMTTPEEIELARRDLAYFGLRFESGTGRRLASRAGPEILLFPLRADEETPERQVP